MRKPATILLLLGLALATTSCVQRPQGERATAGDTLEAGPVTGQALSIDVASSAIEWLGTKPGGSHNGTVGISSGTLHLDQGVITGGEITIDLRTIAVTDIQNEAMNKALRDHLLSPDFFSVDSFPTARFELVRVEPTAQADATHRVTGNLTIKGITRSVSFPATIQVADGQVTAHSPQFLLNRTHWGVNYGSKTLFANLVDNFIHDEMAIALRVSAN